MAHEIERALLRGEWPAKISESAQDPVSDLARQVVNGEFRTALTSDIARETFSIDLQSDARQRPFSELLTFPAREAGSEAPQELTRVILAAACLHAFVQANWTGPDLDVSPADVLALALPPDELDAKATAELALRGEPAYHLARHPAFLRVAQLLLDRPYRHCASAAWWRLRAANVHQQLLEEPAPPLSDVLGAVGPPEAGPELSARLLLEQGLLQHRLSRFRSSADYFVRAAQCTGLEYELTGALGRRTKFQERDTSQLVLLAESQKLIDSPNDAPTKRVDEDGAKTTPMPETLALNDDTLLERTQYTSSQPGAPSSRLAHIDPSSQPPLHPLDQLILLSLCLNIKNTSPADGLTKEQMTPYVDRVISHPRNWSVHTMALLLRSRLEASRTRTVERSTLQLQALIDQMPTSDSTIIERLMYFHSVPLPSKWDMEKELASRLVSIGVVNSAIDIFERLEMWEEVVKCWQALERPDKAIAIVRDLLEGRKEEAETVISRGKARSTQRKKAFDAAREAKLWCLLGDLEPENAVEYYERAWQISGNTSGRAMRSLGGYSFVKGEYDNAITCLRRAVSINPLLARSWFVLGCAYVRKEDWQGAREAFSRCVAIDDEDGESWNNLATVYLRLAEKADEQTDERAEKVPFTNKILAFRALKQGLKSSYNNWRMWNNYMIVSMDVGELAEACHALARVVEETSAKAGAESVDEDVLDRLVNAVTGMTDDAGKTASHAAGARGLAPRVQDLFERVILTRVSSPRIFRAYGRLLTWQSRWEDAIKAHLDGYRCGAAGTMVKGEADPQKWRQAVKEVLEIADILRNFGPRADGYKWQLQGRSLLRSFMARSKEFEDEAEWGTLMALKEDFA